MAHESALPDAAFVFAGRMVAFDHVTGRTYLLSLAEPEAQQWIERTARRLEALPLLTEEPDEGPVDFTLVRPASATSRRSASASGCSPKARPTRSV